MRALLLWISAMNGFAGMVMIVQDSSTRAVGGRRGVPQAREAEHRLVGEMDVPGLLAGLAHLPLVEARRGQDAALAPLPGRRGSVAAVAMVSTRALMVLSFGGTPFAQNGTRPQRMSSQVRSPSRSRTTGTAVVGAML